MLIFALAINFIAYAQYPIFNPTTNDSSVINDLKTGLRYMTGDSITERDYKESVKYLRKAAQQDEAVAQYFLGYLYENGCHGLNRNVQQAFHWYEKSANNGIDEALFKYGLLIIKNEGNPANYRKGCDLFMQAANKGNLNGIYAMGYMYLKGMGVEQNYSEAFSRFHYAASQQHVASIHCLGYCYENGFGVEANLEHAMDAYRFAASKGFEQAIIRLNEIEEKGFKSVSLTDNDQLHTDFVEKGFFKESIPTENVEATQNIDFEGDWEGILYTYDWSGQKVIKEQRVKLNIEATATKYSLVLNADHTYTQGFAYFDSDKIVFEDISLIVKDPLNQYVEENITAIKVGISQIDEQLYLMGNVESFNPTHQEPGSPSYLIVRKSSHSENIDFIEMQSVVDQLELSVYPNPFKNNLNVVLNIKEQSLVEVYIYDLQGRLVATVLDKVALTEGEHSFTFNEELPQGVYLFDLIHNEKHHVKRIIKN